MITIAYKVVRITKTGFESYWTLHNALTYQIGVKTVPKFGKIFVFAKLEYAVELLEENRDKSMTILVGEAENMKGIKRISYNSDDDLRFWKLLKNKKKTVGKVSTGEPAKGTCVADSFTPTKVVK